MSNCLIQAKFSSSTTSWFKNVFSRGCSGGLEWQHLSTIPFNMYQRSETYSKMFCQLSWAFLPPITSTNIENMKSLNGNLRHWTCSSRLLKPIKIVASRSHSCSNPHQNPLPNPARIESFPQSHIQSSDHCHKPPVVMNFENSAFRISA